MAKPEEKKVIVGFTLDGSGKKVPVFAANSDGGEWQCQGCKEMMGASADAYCANCATDDEDDDEPDGDEDEEEAKALGLAPNASAGARRARIITLADFERDMLAAFGVAKQSEARVKATQALESHAAVADMRKQTAKAEQAARQKELRVILERGLAGTAEEPAKLSLGRIQKNMATALRGDTKKAWTEAMSQLETKADKDNAAITTAQVLDAACSVQLSAEDLEAIKDYAETSEPVAASAYVQPERDPAREGTDMQAQAAEVTRLANEHRARLDGKPPAAK